MIGLYFSLSTGENGETSAIFSKSENINLCAVTISKFACLLA